MKIWIIGSKSEIFKEFKLKYPDNEYVLFNGRIEEDTSFNNIPRDIDACIHFIGKRFITNYDSINSIVGSIKDSFEINTIPIIKIYLALTKLNKSLPFIYLSSIAAVRPMTDNLEYCISKSASEMALKVLARKESKSNKKISLIGLRCNLIGDSEMGNKYKDKMEFYNDKVVNKSTLIKTINHYLDPDIYESASGSIISVGEFKEK